MTVMEEEDNSIHIDDLSKVCILEPEVSRETEQLKTECKGFVEEIDDFQKIVGGFIEMVDGLAAEVEKEKMRAIGTRNLLKSVAKQRESEQQQLRAIIAEKQVLLQRYRLQHDTLVKQQQDQQDFIEEFMSQK